MWLFFVACVAEDSGAKETGETTTDGNPAFDLMTWDETGICVTLDSPVEGMRFGMAQTGQGALGWYDEDCVSPNPGDAPDMGFDLCHPVDPSEPWCLATDRSSSPTDLDPETSTLFAQDNESDLSYALFDGEVCWTWGDDPTYYTGFGCTPV